MASTGALCLQPNFPVVFKNKIDNWKMLYNNREDWCNVFKDKVLKFRQGLKSFSESPHWEHLCELKEMTLDEFFDASHSSSDHWLYFDYKYVKDVFPQSDEFVNDLKWTDVGLSDLSEEESVLWIGNKGAHTPCHKDTYGCNLVAQLYGRKLWILMPPEESENLKPIRVPYEESSVYSSLNFYKPTDELLNVKEAYKVVLSRGDVLYVPRHWWHYVENLEPSISINIWIPLEEDHESRLEESLIQYYISTICQELTEEEAKQILNPNEHRLISKPCTIDLIEKCLENYNSHKNQTDNGGQIKCHINGEFSRVGKLSMESFIEEKTMDGTTSAGKKSQPEMSKRVSIAKSLINAYSSQANINAVKRALFEQ